MKRYAVLFWVAISMASCSTDSNNSNRIGGKDSINIKDTVVHRMVQDKEVQPLIESLVDRIKEAHYTLDTSQNREVTWFHDLLKTWSRFYKKDVSACNSIKEIKSFTFSKHDLKVEGNTKYLATGIKKFTNAVVLYQIIFEDSSICKSCFSNAGGSILNRKSFPVSSAYFNNNEVYYVEAENQNDTPTFLQVDSIVKTTIPKK